MRFVGSGDRSSRWYCRLVLLTVAIITGTLEQIAALFVRQGDGDPLAGRGGIWDYVGTKILAHPWFGYGYNIFERYFEYRQSQRAQSAV